MIKRMVYADNTEVQSLTLGSIMDVGDVHRATPRSKVLAIQKEGAHFKSGPFNFEDYSIFAMKSSPPLPRVPSNTFFYQHRPIQIDTIRVIGASTAAVFQIGGIDHIDSISHTKHFRLLNDEQ